jgi:hypothetical protein
MYDTPVEVSVSAAKSDGADHDVFRVSWQTVATHQA